MMLLLFITLFAVNIFFNIVFAENIYKETDSYTIWCVGNCQDDVKSTTTSGIVLMGGGSGFFIILTQLHI